MPKRRRLRKIRLREVSLVDTPANPGAQMLIAKSGGDDVAELMVEALMKSARSFEEILAEDDARRAMWEAEEKLWPLFNALSESLGTIMADGEITNKVSRIRETTEQFLDACRDRFPDVEKSLGSVLLECIRDERRDSMTDAEKKALDDLQEQVNELTKSLKSTNDALEAAEREASLSGAERDYADTLEDKDRAEFVKMSYEDRTKVMEKRSSDESITVDGEIVYKSVVGDVAFRVMKSQQAALATSAEKQSALEKSLRVQRFQKQADEDFSRLPGTSEERATALMAIEDIKDEGARASIHKMLQAGQQAIEKGVAHPETGHSEHREGAGGSTEAEKQMEELAKSISERDSISYEQGFAKAMSENPKLYRDYLSEKTVQ